MKRLRTVITFECEYSVSRSELREFIKDALESWGGQRHPDDHLFGSLERVAVGKFEPVLPKKRGVYKVKVGSSAFMLHRDMDGNLLKQYK
jgi:hypothetical protein